MRIILIVLACLLYDRALADWACDSNNTVLNDDGEVTVCGQGKGMDAEEAKKEAFHAAHLEFWRLCQASSTCKGYEVSLNPERMECTEKTIKYVSYYGPSRWTCKRSIRFMVDRSKRPCDENGRDRYKGCPMNKMPFDGV